MLCGGPLQRAAAARWGRVQRDAQAVVTGEHEGRATGGGGAKMPFILPIRPPHAGVPVCRCAAPAHPGMPTVEAHQQALQGFLDDLAPWMSPAEIPTLVQQPFALFDHLAFTPRGDEDENVVVALSPAGAAVFRAWLRQRGLDPLVCSS